MSDNCAWFSTANATASHSARLEVSEKSVATRIWRKAVLVFDVFNGVFNSATVMGPSFAALTLSILTASRCGPYSRPSSSHLILRRRRQWGRRRLDGEALQLHLRSTPGQRHSFRASCA